jgi:hypothetical protein
MCVNIPFSMRLNHTVRVCQLQSKQGRGSAGDTGGEQVLRQDHTACFAQPLPNDLQPFKLAIGGRAQALITGFVKMGKAPGQRAVGIQGEYPDLIVSPANALAINMRKQQGQRQFQRQAGCRGQRDQFRGRLDVLMRFDKQNR